MRQKGFAPILILLVVVGLGLIAYFSFFYKPPTQPLNQETISPISTATSSATNEPAPKPTTDPTLNWKTYSNKEYGFQIKYPSDWVEKPTAGGIPANISQFIVLDTNYRLPATYEARYVYFDLMSFDFGGKTIQQWVENLKLNGQVNAKISRSFLVNGYTFFEIEGLGSMYETKEYFVKINDKYLNFGLEPFPSELRQELTSLDDTLTQIISTYKFTK